MAQVVLQAGVLPFLSKLLQSTESNIVKEAAGTISNITCRTMEHNSLVIQANIVPSLIQVVQNGQVRCQKKAVLALTNITSFGSIEHLVYLCQEGIIPVYCDLLTKTDWKTVIVMLNGLENILKAADDAGQIDELVDFFKEFGCLDKIQALQSHLNDTVYKKACSIMYNFFADEIQMEDDVTLLPETDCSGNFVFSSLTPPEQGYHF